MVELSKKHLKQTTSFA